MLAHAGGLRNAFGLRALVLQAANGCDVLNVSALRERLAADGGGSDSTSKSTAVSVAGAEGTCRHGLRSTAVP